MMSEPGGWRFAFDNSSLSGGKCATSIQEFHRLDSIIAQRRIIGDFFNSIDPKATFRSIHLTCKFAPDFGHPVSVK
jgi:hypothetical protein